MLGFIGNIFLIELFAEAELISECTMTCTYFFHFTNYMLLLHKMVHAGSPIFYFSNQEHCVPQLHYDSLIGFFFLFSFLESLLK